MPYMRLVLHEVQAPVTERARGKKSLVDGLESVPLCCFHPMLAMAKELRGTFSRARMHRLQQSLQHILNGLQALQFVPIENV